MFLRLLARTSLPGHVLWGCLRLRRALLYLADALVPARLPLYELSTGVARSQILGAFVALGLSQALGKGPQSVEYLAVTLNVSAPHLRRFLRTAAALRLLRRHRDGRFAANRMTRALQPEAWGSMAPFVQYMASPGNVQAWSGLQHVVTTGIDAFTARHGQPVWAWFAARPQDEILFAQAMVALTQADAPAIAAGFPFQRFVCLCDVGGGHGALLTEVLLGHPNLRGMLFDAAAVLATAHTYARGQAVAARVTQHAGSFFEAVPEGADAYLLRHVLHDWDDRRCGLILDNCRRAMAVGHTLLLVESCVEASSTEPLGAIKDLTMAVVCGGQERGKQAMQLLLRASGFELVRIWVVLAPTAVWEARAV